MIPRYDTETEDLRKYFAAGSYLRIHRRCHFATGHAEAEALQINTKEPQTAQPVL